MQTDHYAILGVLPTAEYIVIQAAYRALVQRYHPDRFDGSADDANARTAKLNAAYEELCDPVRRKAYDVLRGAATQDGSEYFADGDESEPPTFDPLAADWKVACRFHPDLKNIEAGLAKLAWRLAYAYRSTLIETRLFAERKSIAAKLEADFLELYFGENPVVIRHARQLVAAGGRRALRALNEAVRILGPSADGNHIVEEINKQYPTKQPEAWTDAIAKYGIRFDRDSWVYGGSRYVKFEDAVEHAKTYTARRDAY